jgi:hypothetical protein
LMFQDSFGQEVRVELFDFDSSTSDDFLVRASRHIS